MIYTYKKIISVMTDEVSTTSIKRLEDGAFIPFDLANTDYQKYLEDVANGAIVEEAE